MSNKIKKIRELIAEIKEGLTEVPIDPDELTAAALFLEAGRLALRRTADRRLALRAAFIRRAAVQSDLAAGLAVHSLTVGGVLTVDGAARLNRILTLCWGNPYRRPMGYCLPGTNGRPYDVPFGSNVHKIGREYLPQRRAERPAHA
jgi:hypothetical protein